MVGLTKRKNQGRLCLLFQNSTAALDPAWIWQTWKNMLCPTAAYLSLKSHTKYTHLGVFEDWADFLLRKCTKYYCVAAEYYSNYIVDNAHAKRWDKISAIMKKSKNKNKKATFPIGLWTLFPWPVFYHHPKPNNLWVACLQLAELLHARWNNSPTDVWQWPGFGGAFLRVFAARSSTATRTDSSPISSVFNSAMLQPSSLYWRGAYSSLRVG